MTSLPLCGPRFSDLRARPESHHSLTWEPDLVSEKRNSVSDKIYFHIWEHAKAVRDFLDQRPLPFCPQAKCCTFLQDPLRYTVNVLHLQYRVQEKHFQPLTPAQNGRSATTRLRILTNRPRRPARTELSRSDKRTVKKLKVRIEHSTAGETQWQQQPRSSVRFSPKTKHFVVSVLSSEKVD